MEAKVRNKKLPYSLRIARRWTVARTLQSEPGDESDLTQRARVRSQTDKHKPGMCKHQWAEHSRRSKSRPMARKQRSETH